ncbi:MAG: DEAD/DEAH box helicase, partial [candidate division NC10 bacterium]
MTLALRPYQIAAIEAVYEHLRSRDDNPVIEIPTAGGKSAIIAQICSDAVTLWGGRVVITAHVKELLEQNAGELVALDPDLAIPTSKVGIYSAGLGEKNPDLPITVAGIQSAFRKPEAFGKVDLVLVDEAHLIPPEGEGMYRTFLAALKEKNPLLRVIGLTATPYRMSTGLISAPENILNRICYSAGVLDLMRQGYLCKLVGKSVVEPDTSDLHIRGGEFVADEAQALMTRSGVVEAACADLHRLAEGRKSVLVFCTGVEHAQAVAKELNRLNNWGAVTLFGDTPADERAETIALFKEGVVRYLVNVNVLTTGFNAPNVDCVAMLRPTMSPGLYYQMVGRGFRLSPGKA